MIKNIKLDGMQSGIIVKVRNSGKGKFPKFVTLADKKTPRLFNNLEIAKLTAKILIPNAKFEYLITVYSDDESITANLNKCRIYNGCYQFFYNDDLYIVHELNIRRTSQMGYLCFENGDTERCEKSYGIKRQYELLDVVTNSCIAIFQENLKDVGISSITNNTNKEVVISLKGTTAKIHIMLNCRLMDLNQAAKNENKKCLKFNKDMDKFTTLYVYTEKDKSETKRLEADQKLETMLGYINDDLVEYYSDLNPKFVWIDMPGYIDLEE